MSRREDRERKAAEWLEHLQGWRESGEGLAGYARRRGLPLWAMYHWRGILRREGRWQEDSAGRHSARPLGAGGTKRVPLRFARVAVTEVPRAAPLVMRVELANGRRTELELGGVQQLGEVLALLEQSR